VPFAALALIAATCSPNGSVIPNFRCPVDGSSYTNNYGPRGSGFHYGIDMLAPTGRTIWAVKSGELRYGLESAGGLVAYLFADDGNVYYYYAHMSEPIAPTVASGKVSPSVASARPATRRLPTCTSRSGSGASTASGRIRTPPSATPAADQSRLS